MGAPPVRPHRRAPVERNVKISIAEEGMPVLEDDFCIKLLPTLLEVLELFYFAEHFLTAKVSRAKRYLANVCFYLLDCGAI